MKYIILYILFVLAGIWLSVADFPFLGRPPNHLTWGRAVFILIPTIFAAFTFRSLATGVLFAGGWHSRAVGIQRERYPKLFFFGAVFYLLISVFIYYVSRYVPGFSAA